MSGSQGSNVLAEPYAVEHPNPRVSV